jgi:uncharacterized OsmC-like protein
MQTLRSADSAAPATGPAGLHVEHLFGDSFAIEVRGHNFLVDQPADHGGEDLAPTPTELFVASLASCVAFYARRYLSRHGLPTEGLAVAVDYEMGSGPARVSAVRLRITVPDGVPDERRDAMLAFAGRCTVHNSITHPPDITVGVA